MLKQFFLLLFFCQKILQQTGGHRGGWDECDHGTFLKFRNRYKVSSLLHLYLPSSFFYLYAYASRLRLSRYAWSMFFVVVVFIPANKHHACGFEMASILFWYRMM